MLDGRQALSVRISQDLEEQFWRVDVTGAAGCRGTMTTTVSESDSFLKHLIDGAIGGEDAAWGHLADWGQHSLARSAPGYRLSPPAAGASIAS